MSTAVCRTPCNLTERRRGALLPDDSVVVQLTARLTNDLSTTQQRNGMHWHNVYVGMWSYCCAREVLNLFA